VRLAAISIGYGIDPDRLSGTVIGLFPGAYVIERDDGLSVALVAREIGNLPFGIVVDAARGSAFAAASLGAETSVRGGVLRFATTDLAIDLRPAYPWRSDLAALGLDARSKLSGLAWGRAAGVLTADGRAVPFIDLARESIASLSGAVARDDARAAAESAARLVGLGEGSTPAGDDFLVGFLGGAWAAAANREPRRVFVVQLGQAVAALVGRTARSSRAYLIAASVGEVSQRLTELLAAIARGDEAEAERTARAAIAVGASSGACGLLGALTGCAAWGVPGLAEDLLDKADTPESLPAIPA